MKKIIALLLALAMLTAFVGCGEEKDTKTESDTQTVSTEPSDDVTEPSDEVTEPSDEVNEPSGNVAPIDVLTTVWNNYDEANKFFAMGGDWGNDGANIISDAPGAIDLSSYDNYGGLIVCSEEAGAMVDAAASLIHGMNQNTFTAAAYHLADAANKDAFVNAMKNSINNNQWMCGFPEKLYIAAIDNSTIVVVFGAADLITTFDLELKEAYATTTVIEDAPIQ